MTDSSLDYGDPSLHLDEVRKHNHSEIEKRRREKMNQLIKELAKLVPMCNAIPSTRKLDKLTVLRMTVQHIKAIKSSRALSDCISQTPSFISDDIIDRLLLQVKYSYILALIWFEQNRYNLSNIPTITNLDFISYSWAKSLGEATCYAYLCEIID